MTRSFDEALEAAEAAMEEGELEVALGAVDEALAAKRDDPHALEVKGHVLAELGEYEQADAIFDRLLAQNPKSLTALVAAADVKIREPWDDGSLVETGLSLLDRAMPLAKGDDVMQAEIAFLQGLAFNHLGEFDEAHRCFEKAVSLEPEHGEAQIERAISLFELARLPEAKKAFERIVRDWPDEAWSYHYLGLIAERRKEDAEAWFAKARERAPEEFPKTQHLTDDEFDAATRAAIDALPEHAKPHLENVTIDVEPLPSDDDLNEGLSPTILGVFQGTPIDERIDTVAEHHHTARIVLFQKNLERFARSREELLEEIRITVLHEVGHLLGLDEDELTERGLD
ncbi:MAG: metallopeptidase family protein [Archangium sp.]